MVNDLFCIHFIHRNAGRQHTASDIRDFCQLKDALNGAVLAPESMQNREYHINADHFRLTIFQDDHGFLRCIRGKDRGRHVLSPALILDLLDRVNQQPFSFFGNADQGYIIALCIYIFNDIDCRHT